MKLNVQAWERERAQAVVESTRNVTLDGVAGGGESIAGIVLPEGVSYGGSETDESVRRLAYSLFPALAILEPKHPFVFNSTWQNYPAAAGTWSPCSYYRDPFGRVWLAGLANRPSGVASVITTLPEGYRPRERKMYAVESNGAHGRVDVLTNGDVEVINGTPNTWISLETISFDTRI